jgi:hypothetical protein
MTSAKSRALLAARTALELVRYDVVYALRGFRGVHAGWSAPLHGMSDSELQLLIPRVVAGACCFYWKKVLCLQRAVVTARLLRRYGFAAEVVIGCRKAPFSGHAWVEIAGAVVNDSPGYQQKLCVLDRF